MNGDQEIRILALLEATSINGVAKAVLQFAEEAARTSRHNPEVVLSVANFIRGDTPLNPRLSDAAASAGCSLHIIREKRAFDFSVVEGLKSLVARDKPDVIWSNSIKSHFLVRVSGLHKSYGWVAFHHGYTSTDFKMRCYNQLDRWSLRIPDRVVTVCQPFARQLTRRGVPADRVRVQHMSVRRFAIDPLQAGQLRTEMNVSSDEKIVLSVGRLSHEKGHADLVKAFARVQQGGDAGKLRLVLVGDGPERSRLEDLCDSLGLRNRVTFAGHRDDAKSFYGIADVLALPSYSEGSPNVLLEALAAQVPVVATAVGGVPEIVENGVSAALVKAGDEQSLAEAIAKMLNARELRERVVANGEAVVARHSPEAFYHALCSVFQEALIRKRGQTSRTRILPQST
jgi:glycosyltransferase involved in cell wall biosynthesis